jgi:class 3 adenylate cyclase
VSRLVLWNANARFEEAGWTPAMHMLAETDWHAATETWAHASLGWSRGEQAHQWAAFMRASISPADLVRFVGAMPDWDVIPLLPQIAARTLVLQQPEMQVDHTQVLTSNIPGAQLVRLAPAPSVAAFEHEEGMRLVDEFLDGAPSRTTAVANTGAASVVTILFTDLVSSTALTQRLGDARAQELVRAHNTIVREALSANGGTEVKHTGDGIMASFPTASGALECAVAIQRGVAQRDEPDLAVHIGVNAGEPVAEESDLFGTSVQLARRICDHASTGQILVSNVVRELSAGKGFLFADIGEVVPKGFDEAVRLYEVRWQSA